MPDYNLFLFIFCKPMRNISILLFFVVETYLFRYTHIVKCDLQTAHFRGYKYNNRKLLNFQKVACFLLQVSCYLL